MAENKCINNWGYNITLLNYRGYSPILNWQQAPSCVNGSTFSQGQESRQIGGGYDELLSCAVYVDPEANEKTLLISLGS